MQPGDAIGTWDSGIFDTDEAYDYQEDILRDAPAFFAQAFHKALAEQGTLWSGDGQAVLVSAAYLDNLFNDTTYRTDASDEEDERNVNRYGQLHPQLRGDPSVMALLPQAVAALTVVLGERSVLDQEWQGAPLHPAWRATVLALQARLQQLLP